MKKLFTLLFIPVLLSAQSIDFPKDTSFTLAGTIVKVKKDYPSVMPVSSALPAGVTAEKNVVYKSIGQRDLHVDIFLPDAKAKNVLPAVMIIHGGGWRSGDKSMEWPTAVFLAAHGYIAITVEYRLSPEALYPAGIQDLKDALSFLKTNAGKYGINKDKIAVSGCSAGGELAAFLGTTGGMEKFGQPGKSSFVQAVIDVDGILDFTHPAESNKDSNPEKPSAGKAWFGSSYKDNPKPWIEASPINYINENTPPFCFINSSLERYHAGRDYAIEKFKAYNIYYEVHTIEDTPHPFWLFHPWFDEAAGYMVNFLDKILKK